MRLTFEPTAFWAVSNIITVFSASPPSKVVGVSLGIYLAVCRAFLRLAFPKLVSALDWHFSHRYPLTFLLPFGSTTTFSDCRFCFILIHFGHRNPTLRYYYQVLSMKWVGETPNTSDVLVTRAVYYRKRKSDKKLGRAFIFTSILHSFFIWASFTASSIFD